MFNVLDLQKKLVAAARPSGFEYSGIAKVLTDLAKPLVDEVYTDTLGNVIAHKKGSGKRLMMPAHMDAIGFVVTHIDDEGFVRFDAIGGHSAALLINTPIRFENGILGCIRLEKMSDNSTKAMNAIKLGNLYIDLGAKDKKEAEKLVRVGDTAVFCGEPAAIGGGNVMGPYADDLIGCVVLLLAMQGLKGKKVTNDLYFVFSVQEEVGLRGATTAAFAINPDMGIAVDVTGTGDCPSVTDKMVVKLGAGPTVKIKDSSLICSPVVVKHLRDCADANKIAYQDEVLLAGGTDSAAMQRTRGGVHSGCISVPTRNIHSAVEIFNINDVEQAGKLLAAAALKTI